ncbi:MAG: M28 family peptidase [Chitinophagaceae bacterium]
MRKTFLYLLLISSTTGFAQKVGKPDAYAKTITADDLKRHLYIVAGPEMQGRDAASEGERKAAQYIENEFKRIGLQPSANGTYRQPFNLYQDSLTGASLEVNGQPFELNKDFTLSVGNALDATYRFSEVVVIGSNAADSLQKADVAGKLVLVLSAGNAGGGRGAGGSVLNQLRQKGAAAILSVGPGFPRSTPLNARGGMSIYNFKRAYGPQQFVISDAVARAIVKDDFESAKSGSLKTYNSNVVLDVQKVTNPLPSSNVIGILPGTDLKDEYLVLTAHYDHVGHRGDSVIFYGADDDGSGTVSVIELAEAFAKAKEKGKGPRRSIVFMLVSAEEKGLQGSAYYGDNPIYPLAKTTANLNIDMIGRIDPERKVGDSTNYVYIVGDDKLSSDLRPISIAANKKTKLELDYKFNDPKDPMNIYYRSDHYNFAKHGVPIIFFFNGTHADYHRPTDTPDKINYPLLAKRAQLVFYTAWEMANRNDMLKRDLELPELRR